MTNAEIDQAIYNTAIEQGFNPTAAKLIVAQARFESADKFGVDYNSGVFKANNNTGGIKYIGASQINAQRGSLAPASERTCGGGCNGDYYAKFNTIQDSINDKIVRLYNLTMRGVTPQQSLVPVRPGGTAGADLPGAAAGFLSFWVDRSGVFRHGRWVAAAAK